MRSRLAALVFVAGCGPSEGTDEACTREDVVTSGALVMGLEPVECSPCDLDTSYVLITLETTCEPGVEWMWDTLQLIHGASAVNLATQEHFEYDETLGQPAGEIYRVTPDEPYVRAGPQTNWIVTEPGDYSFRVELLHDLMAAEFEGSVE